MLLCVGLGVVGCGRGQSAEDRQVDQLRESLSGIQTDNERMADQLTGVEAQRDGRLEKVPPPTTGTKQVAAPDPKTRRIAPDGSEMLEWSAETAGSATAPGDDPEDTTPRPSIKVQGYPIRGSGKKGSQPAQVEANNFDEEPAPPPPPPAGARGGNAPKSSALDPEAKRSYDAALSFVNSKQYPQALEALAAFLVKWPDHPYADNAMYWRGESFYAQGDFSKAAEQFDGLLARFPVGNKVPDALLKLGLCNQKLGSSQKAKSYFERLSREFPRSEAARRIPADGPARREVKP